MSTLWLSSFNEEMFQVSGTKLIDTFIKSKSEGDFFFGTEGISYLKSNGHFLTYDLAQSQFLKDWLTLNSDIIPEGLGGKMKPCNCPDPWARSEKRHLKVNCPHTWFNRNASRWFRKIATLYEALNLYKTKYSQFIWLDSDCTFVGRVTEKRIGKLFELDTEREYDVLILRSHRAVLEAGFVGYNIGCCRRTGYDLLVDLIEMYTSGQFRKLFRYDDCYTLQKCIKNGHYRTRDLARTVDRDTHAGVFRNSLLRGLIYHDKGKHGRELGIMK